MASEAGVEEGLRSSKGKGWRCGSGEWCFGLMAGREMGHGGDGELGQGLSSVGLCSGAAERRERGEAGGAGRRGGGRACPGQPPVGSGTGRSSPGKP